jgi:preprotein translocase subunit SecG
MTTVLIVIHLMVVLALIALILLQRSEGGALGMGGGGGGGGGMMSGRGVGNLLTRTTGILAVAFFATSIGLTVIAKLESRSDGILDQLPGSEAVETAPQGGQIQTPPGEGGTILDDLRQSSGQSSPQTPPAGGDSQ